MAASLQPTPHSVAQLLDEVIRTSWPTDATRCAALWGPLGIRLGEALEPAPGHDDHRVWPVSLQLEGFVEPTLISTPDGRPESLGLFLYRNDAGDADEQTEVAFGSMVAAMTKTWGSDVVDDRSPAARVWRLESQLVELYLHPRPVHPRTWEILGPACLQVGLGPAAP